GQSAVCSFGFRVALWRIEVDVLAARIHAVQPDGVAERDIGPSSDGVLRGGREALDLAITGLGHVAEHGRAKGRRRHALSVHGIEVRDRIADDYEAVGPRLELLPVAAMVPDHPERFDVA